MNQLTMRYFPAFDYAYKEAINTLCTNLTFCGSEKKAIVLTSTRESEGKSFLSHSILRVLAELGCRVLLVDADLRRSQAMARYSIALSNRRGKGLAHYLAGMCTLDEVVYSTNVDNAYMIPVGKTVSNSLALLRTPRLGEMISRLKEEYDYVLIDAPPVGAIIDASEIARVCDGALIVVKYNLSSGSELAESKKQIEWAGCEVLGAIINDVDLGSFSGRKYYNKKYYTKYTSEYGKPTKNSRKPPDVRRRRTERDR